MVPQIQDVLDAAQRLFFVMLLLSMPTLLMSLTVGVAISLLQTVTGVQEMTLTFVPKLFLLGLMLFVTGGWMMQMLMDLLRRAFELMVML